jgi:hypothetical protein
MARARNIKPGFFKNEDLAECTPWARLCFIGLWTLADREGRLEDRPKRIKGELFAFDAIEVEPLLQELEHRRGFIQRYRVSEQALIQILNFGKHQNPHHREAPSTLPAPDGWVQRTAKPEACESSHDPKAQGLPEASPGLSPHEVTLQGVQTVLNPESLFSDSGFSDSLRSDAPPLSGASGAVAPPKPVKQKRTASKQPAPTNATWEAYSEAYERRYGVAPVDNAKVRGQLAAVLKCIPIEEAPQVARYFLSRDDDYFVKQGHTVGILLKQVEALRMQWATGVTSVTRDDRKGRQLQTAALMTGAAQSKHHGFNRGTYLEGVVDGRIPE